LNSGGKLYLVATPIGNLGDITFRAIEVLKNADKVLAEDTRTTRVLFQHYQIETPLVSFHQHNEHTRLNSIVQELLNGAVIAQVSDAGTPGISDPGFLLARACNENGIAMEVIPGATAFIPALLKSGFALHNFVFEGFLPLKKGRQTKLQQLAAEDRTVVLYESPHKLLKTLEQLLEICGPEKRISASREITKKFEETVTGAIPMVLAHFRNQAPKGEFVLVLEGKNTQQKTDE
jgi:16S rRNA (cytidine1402-2'-O)-methyltransferase